MKRHQAATKMSHRGRSERGVGGGAANEQHPRLAKARRSHHGAGTTRAELRSVRVQSHTLKLTGELHLRSAPILEEELERLCEDGITNITLDLRELSYIDSIGMAVIAFRCGLCRRRGYDVRVIAGSPLVHRALEQAGVAGLMPLESDGVAAGEITAPAVIAGSKGAGRAVRKARRRWSPAVVAEAARRRGTNSA
jgi:anti-sigma B factor antagonist